MRNALTNISRTLVNASEQIFNIKYEVHLSTAISSYQLLSPLYACLCYALAATYALCTISYIDYGQLLLSFCSCTFQLRLVEMRARRTHLRQPRRSRLKGWRSRCCQRCWWRRCRGRALRGERRRAGARAITFEEHALWSVCFEMSTTLLYILNNNNGHINVDDCDDDAVNRLRIISYSLSNSIHFTLISFDLRQRMPECAWTA